MPISIDDALHYQFYADTFHDFGKNNNDRRCKLSKDDVVEFHSSHLIKRPIFDVPHDSHIKFMSYLDYEKQRQIVDAIQPAKLKHSHGTYERSVAHYIEQVLDPTETETIQHITIPKESVIQLIGDNAKWGVLEDMGGAKFLLAKQNMYNIQTIASYFDEAPKTQMNAKHICFPIYNIVNPNSLAKIYLSGHIHFGCIQGSDNKPISNYVALHENGAKYDRTLLNAKLMDFSVKNLCAVISQIDSIRGKKSKVGGGPTTKRKDTDTDPDPATNIETKKPRYTLDPIYSKLGKLIHKNFDNLTLTLPNNENLKTKIINDLKEWITSYVNPPGKSESIETDDSLNVTHAINAIYDIKRSLDAGQVEIAKHLQELGDYEYTLPDKSNLQLNNWMFLTKDVLCYERAKLKKVNVVSKRKLEADLFIAQDIDYTLLIRNMLDLMQKKHNEISILITQGGDAYVQRMITEKQGVLSKQTLISTKTLNKMILLSMFNSFLSQIRFDIQTFFFFARIDVKSEDGTTKSVDNLIENITQNSKYLNESLSWEDDINLSISIQNLTELLANKEKIDEETKNHITRQKQIYGELYAKYNQLCMTHTVLTSISEIVKQYKRGNAVKVRSAKKLYIQSWLNNNSTDSNKSNSVQDILEQKTTEFDEQDNEEDDMDSDDGELGDLDNEATKTILIQNISDAIRTIENDGRNMAIEEKLRKLELQGKKKGSYRKYLQNIGPDELNNFVTYLFNDDTNTTNDIQKLSYALTVFGKVNIKTNVINNSDKLLKKPESSKFMDIKFTLDQKALLYFLNVQVDIIHGYDNKSYQRIEKQKENQGLKPFFTAEYKIAADSDSKRIAAETEKFDHILEYNISILKPILASNKELIDEPMNQVQAKEDPENKQMQQGGAMDISLALLFFNELLLWINTHIKDHASIKKWIRGDYPNMSSLMKFVDDMMAAKNEMLSEFGAISKIILEHIEIYMGNNNFQVLQHLLDLLDNILICFETKCISELDNDVLDTRAINLDIEDLVHQLREKRIGINEFLGNIQQYKDDIPSTNFVTNYVDMLDIVVKVTTCKEQLRQIAYPLDSDVRESLLSELHSKVLGHILNVQYDDGFIRFTNKDGSPLFITSEKIALYKRVLTRMFDEQCFDIVQSFPQTQIDFSKEVLSEIYEKEFSNIIRATYDVTKDQVPEVPKTGKYMWNSEVLETNLRNLHDQSKRTLPVLESRLADKRQEGLMKPLVGWFPNTLVAAHGGKKATKNSFTHKGIYYQFSDITQKRLIYYNLKTRK